MNPFVAWAVSWQGTAALMCCALVCGMILGWLTATGLQDRYQRRFYADMRQRREANRAAAQFRAMREPLFSSDEIWGGQWERAQARLAVAQGVPPEVAQETWLAQTDQALALVRDDLTDSAYTADMAARMDRFLEGLCGVPYSADELWSGQ